MVEDPSSPDTSSRDLPPPPGPPLGVSFSLSEHVSRKVTGPPGRDQPSVHLDTPATRNLTGLQGETGWVSAPGHRKVTISRGESEDISCMRASKNHQCPRPNFRCLVYPQSTQQRYLHLLPLCCYFVYNLVKILKYICFCHGQVKSRSH